MPKTLSAIEMRYPHTCARCNTDLRTVPSTVSKFSTEWVCMDCKAREVAHPLYPAADRAELEAVRRGDFNYPGIGTPPELYRPPCKAELFVAILRALPNAEALDNRFTFPDGSRAATFATGAIHIECYAGA